MKGMLRGRALQAVSLALLSALLCAPALRAANPASGTVSGSTPQASWTGGPLTPSAGEPSIGVNRRTGKVMYVAGTETLRITFNDCSSPATAKWENVSAPQTSQVTFDPILFTDAFLGRTYVSQLLPTKLSLMAYTD